jgi:hypothetical protein
MRRDDFSFRATEKDKGLLNARKLKIILACKGRSPLIMAIRELGALLSPKVA